jgi:hypothetical protein
MIEAMSLVLPAQARTAPLDSPGADYGAWVAAIRPRVIHVAKLMIERGDSRHFEDCVRGWRQAEDRSLRHEFDGDAEPLVPVALLWVVAHLYQKGVLTAPAWWLQQIVGEARTQTLISRVEQQIQQSPVDIGMWVSLEMPSGEAHFLDVDSDLLRGLVLSLLVGARVGTTPRFDIGEAIYARRQQFVQILDALTATASSLEADLRISDVPGRLASLRGALSDAVSRYERSERDSLRAASIEPQVTADFASAVQTARDEGFPRWVLEEAGSVHRERREPPEKTGLGRVAYEDKRIVVSANLGDPAGRFFGTAYGEAISRGELQILVDQLSRLPARDWRLPTVTGRLLKAVDRLTNNGTPPSLILVPLAWRLLRSLEEDGHLTLSHRRTSHRDVAGFFDGIRVCDSSVTEGDAYVISLPGAVTLTQYVAKGGELETEIRSLRGEEAAKVSEERLASVAPDPTEDRAARCALLIRFAAIEHIRMTVNPHAAVRVRLPALD